MSVNITGTGQSADLELALNLSSGLMGQWLFDEASGPTALDTSGNGHDGTITNAARYPGKHGGGLNFTGPDPGGNVDLSDDLWAVNMSLEAWVNVHDFGSTNQNYCGKGIVWKSVDTGAARDFTLMAIYCDGIKAFNFWFGNDAANYVSLTAAGVTDWTWYHIVATRNGTMATIYINGASAASKGYSFVPINHHHDLKLGYSVVSGQYYDGMLDDVRIYNRALSAEEVRAHYDLHILGQYVSREKDTGGKAHFGKLHINSTSPSSTTAYLQMRTAESPEKLTVKPFVGPDGGVSLYYTDPLQQIWSGHDGDRWIQYRVIMKSTAYPLVPRVHDVTIDYNLEQSVTVTSPNGGENWTGLHNITWTAADPDGDPLKYDVFLSNDSGATYKFALALGIPSGQTKFQWNTSFYPNGTKYRVMVMAIDNQTALPLNVSDTSDGDFTLYHPYNPSQPPGNHPPVVQNPPDATVYENSTYNYTVVATDSDGDPIDWALLVFPKGAAVLGGLVKWDTKSNFGTWDFKLKVSDGKAAVNVSWKVTVIKRPVIPPTNHPPVVERPKNATVLENATYRISINATDADGDKLTYSFAWYAVPGVLQKPTYTVNGKQLNWSYVAASKWKFNVTVSDGKNATVVDWWVEVVAPPPLPICIITTPAGGESVNGTIDIMGTSKPGAQPVVRVEVSIDGGSWKSATGTASWGMSLDTKSLADGNHQIRARAFDGARYSAEAKVTVVVKNGQTPIKLRTKVTSDFCLSMAALTAVLVVATLSTRLLIEKRKR